MQDSFLHVVKIIYRKWKAGRSKRMHVHPDDTALACFLEGTLAGHEATQIKKHIVQCSKCAESLALQLRITQLQDKDVPCGLIASVQGSIAKDFESGVLDICIALKEKALEVIRTSGDVLVGQELVPAAVMRSRKIKEFEHEVVIFKDFADIRCQVKIENKRGQVFDLIVMVKERTTQEPKKDIRMTLLKEAVELESYMSDSGTASFERVAPGTYTLEIVTEKEKLASINVQILPCA